MKTAKIGEQIKTMVEQGKQRVQKAIGKTVQKAAPKTVQKATPKVTRSTKKPHPGTDPRQPDDRDGNEGFHRANPPTPSKPVRKAPRQASLSKANPRSASVSSASSRKASLSKASPRKASLSKASPRKASPGSKQSKRT